MPATAAAPRVPASREPSMLDLIRLSPRALFPPGGVDLYRQIALLTGMGEGDEVLDVACGKAVALEYFVREYGVAGSGVDSEARLIDEAERRVRGTDVATRLHLQTGSPDALPYRDAIFDVTVGEIGLSTHCDPAEAVRELVRVTKPGGSVVLVQLVWKTGVDEGRRQLVQRHLGARPLMMVEWKRLLREAGVGDLHTEDWADDETSFRARGVKPFPDFTEIFTFSEKVGIIRRAWTRYGWRGVRALLARELAIHRLLTRDRTIGLDLIKGERRVGETSEGDAPVERSEPSGSPDAPAVPAHPEPEAATPGADSAALPAQSEQESAIPGADPVDASSGHEPHDPETAGLPLFGVPTHHPTEP